MSHKSKGLVSSDCSGHKFINSRVPSVVFARLKAEVQRRKQRDGFYTPIGKIIADLVVEGGGPLPPAPEEGPGSILHRRNTRPRASAA